VQHQTYTISNNSIRFIISKRNLEALRELFKYEPATIGTICNLIQDSTLTEVILKESFSQLKERGIESSKNAIHQNGVQIENIHLFSNPIIN